MNADLKAILDDIPRLTPEQLREREAEDELVAMRDGWLDDSRDMPRMPWARFSHNAPWIAKFPPRLLNAINGWRPRSRGLVLLGGTGLGKTSSLVARLHEVRQFAKDARRQLPRFLWTTEARLKQARREHALGRGEAPLIRRAVSVRHLIVDELGPANATELMHATIVDERYARGLPTTITSGLTADELGKRYGYAMVRRLNQHADIVDLHEEKKR